MYTYDFLMSRYRFLDLANSITIIGSMMIVDIFAFRQYLYSHHRRPKHANVNFRRDVTEARQ
jgi:hypothetical protein